jgi:hypothetical protein
MRYARLICGFSYWLYTQSMHIWWAISGTYFGLNMVSQGITGMTIGQGMDKSVQGMTPQEEYYFITVLP